MGVPDVHKLQPGVFANLPCLFQLPDGSGFLHKLVSGFIPIDVPRDFRAEVGCNPASDAAKRGLAVVDGGDDECGQLKVYPV